VEIAVGYFSSDCLFVVLCTKLIRLYKVKAVTTTNIIKQGLLEVNYYLQDNKYTTAGWSSGLRSRLRNQRSQVHIPVVSRSFCNEQLQLLTSNGCLYILIIIITYICTIYVCLSVI
jgi:hypothetical protein